MVYKFSKVVLLDDPLDNVRFTSFIVSIININYINVVITGIFVHFFSIH